MPTRQTIVFLGERGQLVSSFTGSKWIATGYTLAMTRVIRNAVPV
ncbi:MAG: hypothetical protein ACJZ64_01940 [Opitutales bacterium]